MSQQGMCLKVSYRGILRTLYCNSDSKFKDVITLAIEQFNLPEKCASAVKLFHKTGYAYDEEMFNKLVLLNPKPRSVFCVQLDKLKISVLPDDDTVTADETEVFLGSDTEEEAKPSALFKAEIRRSQNDISAASDDGQSCATPVFRQNCFYGALPTSSSSIPRQQEVEHSVQYAKRQRTLPRTKRTGSKR